MALATFLSFALLSVFAPALAAGKVPLSFTPADAVSNGDGSVIYLSDFSGKKVYSLNTNTNQLKSISFSRSPDSMFYKDGKLYVSLCDKEHSSYWLKEDQKGAFAIVDCASFAVTAQHSIDIDPGDIVVSNNNTVYIASGSGQWTYFCAYRQNGTSISKTRIRQASNIVYNPILNKVYTITTDSSPRDISAYILQSDGGVSSYYDSRYHGDYPMGKNMRLSPDGTKILNDSGNIFTCSSTNSRDNDILYASSINRSWLALSFSKDGSKFYIALSNRQIYTYNYSTLSEETAKYESEGHAKYLFTKGNSLIVVSREASNSGSFFVETVSLTGSNTSSNPGSNNSGSDNPVTNSLGSDNPGSVNPDPDNPDSSDPDAKDPDNQDNQENPEPSEPELKKDNLLKKIIRMFVETLNKLSPFKK